MAVPSKNDNLSSYSKIQASKIPMIKHGDMFVVKNKLDGKVSTFMVEPEKMKKVVSSPESEIEWFTIGTNVWGCTTHFEMKTPDMKWEVLRGRLGWSPDSEVFHVHGNNNKSDDICFIYLVSFNTRKTGEALRLPSRRKEFNNFSNRSFSTRENAYNYLRNMVTVISEGTDDEKLESLLENPNIYSLLKHKTGDGDPQKIEQFETAFDVGNIYPLKIKNKDDFVEIRKIPYNDSMTKSAEKS